MRRLSLHSTLRAFRILLALAATLSTATLVAQETTETAENTVAAENTGAEALLDARYRTWLEDVELLISPVEKEVFLGLNENYRRDTFIRRFWTVRDPFTDTRRNEFQENWQARVATARQQLGGLKSERAEMLLFFGEPSRRLPISCSMLRSTLEVWYYEQGSEIAGRPVAGQFTLVFTGRNAGSRGHNRLWRPIDGLSSLLSAGQFQAGQRDTQIADRILQNCSRGSELLASLAQTLDVDRIRSRGALVPQLEDEWVLTFKSRSTDLPEAADLLEGELDISFPGRHQSRTVVQGLVTLPRDQLAATELGDHRSYQLLVDGEVLRKGELFDQFRYRFSFPADAANAQLPLVVQRYLRPGDYTWIVKVEDSLSQKFFRRQIDLNVPRVQAQRQAVTVAADGSVRTVTLPPEGAGSEQASAGTSLLFNRLAEANASISTGDHSIKIMSLPDQLQVGKLRVQARVRGDGIAKVAFELNDRPVMSKSRPPFSVEVDLGDKPRTHTLAATALDSEGRRLATDEIVVNSGPHRFDIRLLEPQRGKTYAQSIRAHAEVAIPEGERLDRVELFLNDTLMATLYQSPFEQPILLPEGQATTYIRAVAHLADGSSAEAVEFINAPDYVDEMRVQFVELYTSVLDRKGEFIDGLSRDDFEVFEDGEKQQLRRFETMRDLPIRAGLVLDTSLSMMDDLRDVEKAAYRFLETVLTSRDRAALITFNDEPHLAVRFTNDKSILAGGLAELVSEGETALYDSLIFGLHYFSGLKGKRALIVLTDGEDSRSKYRYEEVIEFARRTGVAVYIIALNLTTNQRDIRSKIFRLAKETGGKAFFIDHVLQLGRVYDAIQAELRSQYLLAYQSSQLTDNEKFREVEVRTNRKGLEAKTFRGYYP